MTADQPRDAAMAALPVGAYVASALMAANIPCDSGEDVDRFLNELESRGYAVVPIRAEKAADARACPACGRVASHDFWTVGDDSYACDRVSQPRYAAIAALLVDLIKSAIASAIQDRLEGEFDVELARWEKEAGVEQMGTGTIEAHFLANIASEVVKGVTDSEIAERVAEYLR